MSELYDIGFTPFAESQIDKIVGFLEEHESGQVANQVKNGIFDAIEGLIEMPDRHSILLANKKRTYRRVLKWSYMIVFYIRENEKEVVIVDVTHTRQDPQKLIDKLAE